MQRDGRNDEHFLNEANSRPRISWRGIFAGLIAGLAVQLVLTALGIAIGAATVDSLQGLGIGALIWAAVSLAISAYAAGFTAVRAGNQELATRGQFTGLITGMLMVFVLGNVLANGLLAGLRGASSVVSGVTQTAASAASAASDAGAGNAVAGSGTVQSIVNGLNPTEIGQLVSQAAPELSPQQATAAANVVSGIVQRASNSLGANAGNISSLPDLITNRVNSISSALQGQDFVNRLQKQGLSQAQATATATAINQRVTEIKQQAADTAAAAERIARRTAQQAAWGALLAAGLIIGLSTFGGSQASSTRRKMETAAEASARRS